MISHLIEKKVGLEYILLMKTKLLVVVIILLVAAVGTYFLAIEIIKKQVQGRTEINEVMKVVSKYIELPDEIPTIATVTDKTKLGSQPFFTNAENGDKVLMFAKSQKVILYRPTTKKIINVSTLSITDTEVKNPGVSVIPTVPVEETSEKNIQVNLALYNGSSEVGLATKIEKEIFGGIKYFKVVSKKDARRNDYEKTLVVDISGKYAEIANSLAEDLSAEMTTLPKGEIKPAADILVILGKNHP
jgi:hypothetical protein